MDFVRQKSKKRQPNQHDSVKPPMFVADLKTVKENLKIKEILRTVKINSSMRIKAPRGSKVMSSKDLTEANDFETNEEPSVIAEKYASNPDVSCTSLILDNEDLDKQETDVDANLIVSADDSAENIVEVDINSDTTVEFDNDIEKSTRTIDDVIVSLSERIKGPIEITVNGKDVTNQVSENDGNLECAQNIGVSKDTLACLPTINNVEKPLRVRKLSLDQTMLSRRASCLSQSEVDLHTVGKLPLERKSSFFKKKMENFVENTSKIFKRQSMTKADGMQRRGSMSYSLQSLNDKNNYNNQFLTPASSQDFRHGSISSLNSVSTAGISVSSQDVSQANSQSPGGNQPSLSGSQPLSLVSQIGGLSESVHSLNEAYIQEQMFGSRAISMSSGLDSATGTQKRRSRSNRVTWLASEGLTNYLRRVIQDESSKEDSRSRDSRNRDSKNRDSRSKDSKTDSWGRRLSYQRAVSGEDPVRYNESSLRGRQIPEHCVANNDLADILSDFTRNGAPPLKDFHKYQMSSEGVEFLQQWADINIEILDKFQHIPHHEEDRQAVIREMLKSEADYIQDLTIMVESYMAAAHALQHAGWLLDVNTERIFSNLPDVYNATLTFWDKAIVPMLVHAEDKNYVYNTDLMYNGFYEFRDIFRPYDYFLRQQARMLEYLKLLNTNSDFMMFAVWCQEQTCTRRLLLSDMLSKPMQRLTRYGLLIQRIATYTETEPSRTTLINMERFSRNHVIDLNRSIRQRDELDKLQKLVEQIEPYELDFKDEDMDRLFRCFSNLNLQAPMTGCEAHHSRSIIHDTEVKFRDNLKEMDARAILLTDMLLIVKKQTKGNKPYKLIRPKYMLDKLTCYVQMSKNKNSKDFLSLICISVDDVGSSQNAFSISGPIGKDNNLFVKVFDNKVRQAKLTYELAMWYARNPSREVSEGDYDSAAEYNIKSSPLLSEAAHLEKNARVRVATMLHRSASTEHDFSQTSMPTDSSETEKMAERRERCEQCVQCERCERISERSPADRADEKAVERAEKMAEQVAAQAAPSVSQAPMQTSRTPTLRALRHNMKRLSNASSRTSRMSSFHHSSSPEEVDPQPSVEPSRIIQRSGAVEMQQYNPLDGKTITTITVNVMSESDSETTIPRQQFSPSQPTSRSSSSINPNTLMVQPHDGVMALMHSLPDLTIDPSPSPHPQIPSPVCSSHSSTPRAASGRMYQSHLELLYRNRILVASAGNFLTPYHRGTSYPPPAPSRYQGTSLRRSMAVSYSIHHPPLHRMGRVNSQSSHLIVDVPSSRPSSAQSVKFSSSFEQTSQTRCSVKNKGGVTKQQMKQQAQLRKQRQKNRETERTKQMKKQKSQRGYESETSSTQGDPSTSKTSPASKTKSFILSSIKRLTKHRRRSSQCERDSEMSEGEPERPTLAQRMNPGHSFR